MTVKRAIGLQFCLKRGYGVWYVYMGKHECAKRRTQVAALSALIALADMMATL